MDFVRRHLGLIGYLILCAALFAGGLEVDHEKNTRVEQVEAEAKARTDALAAEAEARVEAFYAACRDLRASIRDNFIGLLGDFVRNPDVVERLTARVTRDFNPDDCIRPG